MQGSSIEKTLEYKGHVVFKKLTIPAFKRFAREFASNEACFAFFTEGEYQVRTATGVLTVNRDIGLLAKCVNYFYETVSGQLEQGRGEVIGVFLFPDIFQRLFHFDFTQSDYQVDYDLKQVEVDQLLTHFRDSISILLDTPDLATPLMIETKLREFVLLMTQKVSAPSELDFLASMFKPNFVKFEQVIQHHLFSDVSIEELAALCHMSVSSFKRKFGEVYGQSPKKHISQLKIDKAISLLDEPSSRVSDIVFQTGFESISTFNRVFKKHIGCSPSEYRQRQSP
jgi:AraC-like DNA-binding protein